MSAANPEHVIGQSTFSRVMQLAYVTTDLSRAVEVFGRSHGIARFLEMRDFPLATEPEGQVMMHVALAMVDGTEIEVIEPCGGNDDLYRGALDDTGFQIRFHHVAGSVERAEDLGLIAAECLRAGRQVALRGNSPSGARNLVVDDRDTVGHYTEYIYRTPESLQAFLARLPTYRSASAAG